MSKITAAVESKVMVNNAVLVSLNISSWDANCQDKRVSKDVADANNVTDTRACRLRKSLLPNSELMKRLRTAMSAARNFHYRNTLAWMHDGPRMLATANFDAYMTEMRQLRATFEACVDDVVACYDDLREDARQVLGTLYNPEDYPSRDSLKRRYGFEIKIQPMPASEGLLSLGLADEEVESLRAKLEADMAETFERAHRRLWEELYERLGKLRSAITDEKSTVREKAISSIRELAELLPRMNIMNDERLDMLSERLLASLEGVTASDIKVDARARANVASQTQDVFDVMQAFMNPASLDMPSQELADVA